MAVLVWSCGLVTRQRSVKVVPAATLAAVGDPTGVTCQPVGAWTASRRSRSAPGPLSAKVAVTVAAPPAPA